MATPADASGSKPQAGLIGGQSVWQSSTLSNKVGLGSRALLRACSWRGRGICPLLGARRWGNAVFRQRRQPLWAAPFSRCAQVPAASKGLTITLAGLRHTFVVRKAVLRCQTTTCPLHGETCSRFGTTAGGGPGAARLPHRICKPRVRALTCRAAGRARRAFVCQAVTGAHTLMLSRAPGFMT
jgi:hypothetical protein